MSDVEVKQEVGCAALADWIVPPPSYVALFNPTPYDVVKVYQATSGVFIFVFLVSQRESLADFADLPESDYIARPIHLGDLTKQEAWAAAMACIEGAIGKMLR